MIYNQITSLIFSVTNASDSLTFEFLILFIAALIVSAIGFYNVVYFVSVGYAFSVVATVFAALVLFWDNLSVFSLLQCGVLAVYGIRLGTYLLRREIKQASYRKQLNEVEEETSSIPFFVKIVMWVTVAVLYILMISPAIYNLSAAGEPGTERYPIIRAVGIGIMLCGLILETVADQQKSAFKRHSPDRFCDIGVYRWVRFPNYFGEIIFWTGNWVAGLAAYVVWHHWIASLAGLLGIIFVMLVSSVRLERKQDQRYGNLSDYQTYNKCVPILIPFLPIYSLLRTKTQKQL